MKNIEKFKKCRRFEEIVHSLRCWRKQQSIFENNLFVDTAILGRPSKLILRWPNSAQGATHEIACVRPTPYRIYAHKRDV